MNYIFTLFLAFILFISCEGNPIEKRQKIYEAAIAKETLTTHERFHKKTNQLETINNDGPIVRPIIIKLKIPKILTV